MAYFTIVTVSMQVISIAATSWREAVESAREQGFQVKECREAR